LPSARARITCTTLSGTGVVRKTACTIRRLWRGARRASASWLT
jgi:hypothetical protein